jgi:glycosyltransferase involved in cell wall biosynthesis
MNTSLLRPLFVTGSLTHGGAERHSVTLMNRLAERGHDCHGVYLRDESSQIDLVRLPDGGSIFCPDVRRYLDLAALARLARHLRRLQPDVLIAANQHAMLYAALARWQSGIRAPLIVTFHSTSLLNIKEHLKMLLERRFFARADCLVYVCEAQRRHWQARHLMARDSRVIVNGVDTAHFALPAFKAPGAALRQQYGLAAEDFVVGISAVLRPEKNHLLLVEAIAALRRQGLPARALMIGDGEMRPAVEARARSLNIADAIIITGLCADVRPALAASDVVTLCSTTEALSLAALEAMAMSRPVVHSDVGGAREIIEPWLEGFIFESGNGEQLARRLAQLADPKLARLMGNKARETVESRFSEHRMVDHYEQLLREFHAHGLARREQLNPDLTVQKE